MLCACNFLAVAEATRLALDGGVDAAKVPAALAGGRADSRILQEFMPKMAAFDYTPTGRIDNMLKDLEAVQRYAMALRTPMPLTGLVTELHRIMVAAGIGPEDSAAYMKLFDFGRGASAAGQMTARSAVSAVAMGVRAWRAHHLVAAGICNDSAVRRKYSDRLILEGDAAWTGSPAVACAATSGLWRRDAHTGSAFVTASTAASIMAPCFTLPRCSLRMR